MIIIAQDKSLINMDKISYIYVSNNGSEFEEATTYTVMAEDNDTYYNVGIYYTNKEAQKQVDRIRQSIEEGWKTCEVS